MEFVPDWSALPTDLLVTIASSYCTTMEDFMAFRGVCTSWRAAATKDTFVAVSKVPLLMLAEKEGSSCEREFYSLAKRKIFTRTPLPGAKGKRCNDVGFGWILTKASTGELCLMKPFSSSAVIQLPNFNTFPNYRIFQKHPKDSTIVRAWLKANPSESSDFTLLIDGCCFMGIWRNGDNEREFLEGAFTTVWKGKVYAYDLDGFILVWDSPDLTKSDPLILPMKNGPTRHDIVHQNYLVGSSDGDQLLMIRRNNAAGVRCSDNEADHFLVRRADFLRGELIDINSLGNDTGADHFRLRRVDLVRGELIEIFSLGKDAAFIGDNAAVCVDATEFPGILKPNCIYFTDDRAVGYYHGMKWGKGGGEDMGIYNVEDRSIERFEVESYSFVCPPMWVFPSF